MNFECKKCRSKNLTIKSVTGRNALYCKDCNTFLQWLDYDSVMFMHEYLQDQEGNELKAYKRMIKKENATVLKCSECNTQLYNSSCPKPQGQYDLINARFCPVCGREFI